MLNDSRLTFRVGELDVAVDTVHGEAVEMSATDPKGFGLTDGGFVFDTGGGDCIICRKIGGQWVCWEISCNLIDVPHDLKG